MAFSDKLARILRPFFKKLFNIPQVYPNYIFIFRNEDAPNTGIDTKTTFGLYFQIL